MNLSLTFNDLFAVSPFLILLGGALFVLLLESFAPQAAKKFASWATLATILLALWAALATSASNNPLLSNWLKFDSLSRFFAIFFLLIGFASTCLAAAFFERFVVKSEGEYYFLLLSALFGLLLI